MGRLTRALVSLSPSHVLAKRYHGQASYLPNGYVELPEVQRLLAHSGQMGDGCAPLLHEAEVSFHPAPPFWLHAKLEQPRDSLPTDAGRVRVGFLMREPKKVELVTNVTFPFQKAVWV